MSFLPTSGRAPSAPVRLFLFPYAGGGASAYRDWQKRLSPAIDVCPVQLPGRENRFREPAITDAATMAKALADALAPALDKPWVAFGHSVGALTAYLFAQEVERRGLRPAKHLIASARNAPDEPSPEVTWSAPDAEFVGWLKKLGGLPEEVLAHEELMELVLPTLRADVKLEQTTVLQPAPLSAPLTAFGGRQDPFVTDRSLDRWSAHTGDFRGVRYFDGGHFFLHSAKDAVLAAVAELCGVTPSGSA